jgi:hypothetical protein
VEWPVGLQWFHVAIALATGRIPNPDLTVYVLRLIAHNAVTVFIEPPPSWINTP